MPLKIFIVNELSSEQYNHVKRLTNQIHNQFIDDLKKSRTDKLSSDKSIYSGLFYTGTEALSLGLIDGLSSLYDLRSNRYENLPIQKYNRDDDVIRQILKSAFYYFSESNIH